MITADLYFEGARVVSGSAPGRVNLLGEHTDYNDGYMLPLAIPQRTEVLATHSADDSCHFYSATLDQGASMAPGTHAPAGFGRYLEGCIVQMQRWAEVPPLRLYVRSRVPVGAGLSSSAALEVAALRTLRRLLGVTLDDVTLARMARQAEIDYAGVPCGIMDQMASSLGDQHHLLFIDARSLAWERLPPPPDSAVIVIDSGQARTLATSAYQTRRAECAEAARLLGVAALRDVADPAALALLPAPYRQRARHVVTENLRVLEARAGVDGPRFGALMNASHASLREDFAVSTAALDTLSALLREHDGVFGARLTGAGFGGACVALCRGGYARAIGAQVTARFNKGRGGAARLLVPPPERAPTERGGHG